MKPSKLIVCLVIVGSNFAFFNSAQTMAEQEEQSTQPPQQSADGAGPKLKPDLPKLDTPKPPSAPIKHNPLKGSIQHSEVVEPNKANAIPRQGQLDGNTGRGIFQFNERRINGGLNQNKTTGLGIIGLKFAVFFGHTPIIYQIFPGTPAAEAGLKPKDTIIAVDGIPTLGLAKNEVYNMIVGQPGTQVTLSIRHGHGFQTCTLTRMDVNAIPDPRVRQDYLSM